MKNKCYVCGSKSSVVAVRYREKSIVSMCPKCIDGSNIHATQETLVFMVNFMRYRGVKCNEDRSFDNDCCEMITTFIWKRNFNDWIEGRMRR